MAADPAALESLKDLLKRGLSANNVERKEAERYMESVECQHGFLLMVLQLIALLAQSTDPQDKAIRQFGAVFFKNVIKRRWKPDFESDASDIVQTDKEAIKSHLVELMCTTPSDIQKQLAEAVTIIAKHDFPKKWDSLLPQLVGKLGSNDINITKGVMLTANSIMKHFRYAYKSDALYEVVIVCLEGFAKPLLDTFRHTKQLIESYANDKPNLLVAMETQRLIMRVYFSLNWQDIPEFFENTIETWMEEFAYFLRYSNPLLLDSSEESEPGPIEKLQAALVENLNLYATKYEEEFQNFLGGFTQQIWQRLLEVGNEPKYDLLVTSGIKFLTSVCSKQMNTALFTEQVLKDIIEQIVIRNLTATQNDEELFEDNPTDYIRKDMEGSDQDTRRRSAMELIRALCKFFKAPVSTLCVNYIQSMLEQYRTQMDWRAKDAALHLVLAVSVMSSTAAVGAGELNPNVDVLGIFTTHVLPEVHDTDVNARAIVKADAIKMICVFRSHFPASYLLELLPHVIRHLTSEYVVVQTYAAYCVERFLSIKDRNATTGVSDSRISKEHLMGQINPLFTGLFAVLDNPELPENDYVMKCIMRSLVVIGSEVSPVVAMIVPRLTSALERVCKNPVNPHFNHYLFESIAVLVKSTCGAGVEPNAAAAACAEFETRLFPPFQAVLSQDVTEFVPYVFQVLAQLLLARPAASGLSEAYRTLFPPLLSPVLWEQRGNVPALTDLFRAYISVGINEIISGNHLQAVLGIFQKLIASKATDMYAFKLVNALYAAPSADKFLAPFLGTIVNLQLLRLQELMKDTKTPKFAKSFLHSLSYFACMHGGKALYDVLESLSAGLSNVVIVQIWPHNRQACATLDDDEVSQLLVGASKLLCETPVNTAPEVWGEMLKSTVTLLGVKHTHNDLEDTFLLDEEGIENREFDSAYSKLAYAIIPDPPLPAEMAAAPAFFANQLSKLCSSKPGAYLPVIQKVLSPEEQSALQGACQKAGVSLV
jgi:exportin-2 (importin alpha re-exporter)